MIEKTSSDLNNSSIDSDVDFSVNDSDSMDVEEETNDNSVEGVLTKTHTLTENPAWADAMAKILKTNKPKRRKTIVLSRAKRANEIKTEVKEENIDFEIDNRGYTEVKKEKNDEPVEENKIKMLKVSKTVTSDLGKSNMSEL